MEALLIQSRHIHNDKTFFHEHKRRYQKHIDNIRSISLFSRQKFKTMMQQSQYQKYVIENARQASKSHQANQFKQNILKENKILMDKIRKAESVLNKLRNSNSLKNKKNSLNQHSRCQWNNKIMLQNKMIMRNLVYKQNGVDKNKIKQSINQYLTMRKNIRKFLPQHNKRKIHSSKK